MTDRAGLPCSEWATGYKAESFLDGGIILRAPNWYSARRSRLTREDTNTMNSKGRLVIGILTAVAMFLLTFVLPRGGPLQDASLAQFPLTAGVWSIFVLLFVKLK